MKDHSKPSTVGKSKVKKAVEANRIRIIGGAWRSRVIDFPDVEGLRPTANRVRETLFNWLGQTLHDKRCLDLFAGSGALGFEAASRGAAAVVMVENSRPAMLALKKNQEKLSAAQCRLVTSEATDFLKRNGEKFDIIFIDPPFGSGLMPIMLAALAEHLADDGQVYAEWGEPLGGALPAPSENPWAVVKHGKAGAVHFGLLAIARDAR
ncbi:MAG: 16S rRNA (guanine(966)-N(2))-methyltransferase RsmD [Betaproteobacteria bacterium]